jgi:CHAD domain-containing protein
MPYKLQKDEPLDAGLKRVAEEQLTNAINELQAQQELQVGIYQARKSLKKVRAILRLVALPLGPVYVEENRRLRDVARKFGTLRDSQVSLELLDEFSGRYKRKSTLNPQKKAIAEKQQAMEQQTDWHAVMAESVKELIATRRRVEDWPLAHLTAGQLHAEIAKTHKQSKHALEKARKTGHAEDFHEFRKSVKRELNQAQLFESTNVASLKQLAKLLGDHHNLAVLLGNLNHASARFSRMVRRDMLALEQQILDLGFQSYEAKRSAVA